MRRGDATTFLTGRLEPGEVVLLCLEAEVADVGGRTDAADDVEAVLLVLTGGRLLTLAWRGGPTPEIDASIPREFVAEVRSAQGPFGTSVVVTLTTGAWVRFLVSAADEADAEVFVAALGERTSPVREHPTEEIPIVVAEQAVAMLSPEEVEQSRSLADQLAALYNSAMDPQRELAPPLTIVADPAAENTYFVAVHAERVPEGVCPRCRHENRHGAVFCDACGALV